MDSPFKPLNQFKNTFFTPQQNWNFISDFRLRAFLSAFCEHDGQIFTVAMWRDILPYGTLLIPEMGKVIFLIFLCTGAFLYVIQVGDLFCFRRLSLSLSLLCLQFFFWDPDGSKMVFLKSDSEITLYLFDRYYERRRRHIISARHSFNALDFRRTFEGLR